MSVSSVASLSMEPPSLLVCINQAARMQAAMTEGSSFCVNILHREHEALARRFANSSLDNTERFAEGDWDMEAPAGPQLAGALANLQCLLERRIEFGSHAVCIGVVTSIARSGRMAPLVYAHGQYSALPGSSLE